MNTLGLQASPLLAPALSPRLQRAVRLLQMSSLDYAREVRQQLETNPFLEEAGAAGDGPDTGEDGTGAGEESPAADEAAEPPLHEAWDAAPPGPGRAEVPCTKPKLSSGNPLSQSRP